MQSSLEKFQRDQIEFPTENREGINKNLLYLLKEYIKQFVYEVLQYS